MNQYSNLPERGHSGATVWSRKHPWFEEEVLPALRAAIRGALQEHDGAGQLRTELESGTLIP